MMTKEMIKVIRSMGYRLIEGSKTIYGKPMGYSLLTFDADIKFLLQRFINIKNEISIWSVKDFSKEWDSLSPEDFAEAIKQFETWEVNMNICEHSRYNSDIQKFNFLTNEENYAIEMGA